jgi:hypothetical protein
MKALDELRSFRASRNPLVGIGMFVIVMWLAYKTAQLILTDDLPTLGLIVLLVVGASVLIAVLNDWRRGLYVLVAWILFEDLFRKYLGNNMMIYFGKDALALILYISFFRAKRANRVARFRIPFRVPLLLFLWCSLIQVFNPASTSFFYGILGLKINFLYVPLIYVGDALINSEEDLRRFFSYLSVLIILVAGLGLAQSIIGPSFLNPSTLQDDIRELSTLYRVSPISGLSAYRPTSVFVSSGRFADFLIVAWLISLGFAGYLLLRSRRGRAVAFTAVAVVAAASLMSASRGVFMWNAGTALVIITGFLWGAPWRQREALRVLRTIQRTALMVACAFVLLLMTFPEELGSRIAIYSETLRPDSPASELIHRTQTYPWMQLGYAFSYPTWPYGTGLGTHTLGMQYVTRIMHAEPMELGVESGFGNLLLELGIVGLVLWIVLGASIVISASRVVRELKGTPWFPIGFVILLYVTILWFPMMFTGVGPYQDFVLNSNLWLLLGVLFRLRLFPKAIELAKEQVAHSRA